MVYTFVFYLLALQVFLWQASNIKFRRSKQAPRRESHKRSKICASRCWCFWFIKSTQARAQSHSEAWGRSLGTTKDIIQGGDDILETDMMKGSNMMKGSKGSGREKGLYKYLSLCCDHVFSQRDRWSPQNMFQIVTYFRHREFIWQVHRLWYQSDVDDGLFIYHCILVDHVFTFLLDNPPYKSQYKRLESKLSIQSRHKDSFLRLW